MVTRIIRWITRGIRRERRPVVPWVPDERTEEERLESYADQLLRELGHPYGVDVEQRRWPL